MRCGRPDWHRPARAAPHPRRSSLVGSYVYSYDVATASRPFSPGRSIPSMRPSYDAEHPNSATPIYDSLYSEYRRLFRALPGDRSGEENLRFVGFSVREPHRPTGEPTSHGPRQNTDTLPYPLHQAFQTYAGHADGLPQYMPSQPGGESYGGHTDNAGQGWVATGYLAPAGSAQGNGGRHRSMLSLPPGRSSENG